MSFADCLQPCLVAASAVPQMAGSSSFFHDYYEPPHVQNLMRETNHPSDVNVRAMSCSSVDSWLAPSDLAATSTSQVQAASEAEMSSSDSDTAACCSRSSTSDVAHRPTQALGSSGGSTRDMSQLSAAAEESIIAHYSADLDPHHTAPLSCSSKPCSPQLAATHSLKPPDAVVRLNEAVSSSSFRMWRKFMKCMMTSVVAPCDDTYDRLPAFPHPFFDARVVPVPPEPPTDAAKSVSCMPASLLPCLPHGANLRKTLILDLDETLVHSSFQPVPKADFVLPVPMDDHVANVYVIKRPGVDQFLATMAAHFELVVFTASLRKYADPLLDVLDPKRLVAHRLFREACRMINGHLVKDLSLIGRDLDQMLILDNSPHSYALHPENALPISSFVGDAADTRLPSLVPFLVHLSNSKGDLRKHLAQLNKMVLHF